MYIKPYGLLLVNRGNHNRNGSRENMTNFSTKNVIAGNILRNLSSSVSCTLCCGNNKNDNRPRAVINVLIVESDSEYTFNPT